MLAKKAEIEQAVVEAYTNGCADPLWQTIQGLRSAATAVTLPSNDEAEADEDARAEEVSDLLGGEEEAPAEEE